RAGCTWTLLRAGALSLIVRQNDDWCLCIARSAIARTCGRFLALCRGCVAVDVVVAQTTGRFRGHAPRSEIGSGPAAGRAARAFFDLSPQAPGTYRQHFVVSY